MSPTLNSISEVTLDYVTRLTTILLIDGNSQPGFKKQHEKTLHPVLFLIAIILTNEQWNLPDLNFSLVDITVPDSAIESWLMSVLWKCTSSISPFSNLLAVSLAVPSLGPSSSSVSFRRRRLSLWRSARLSSSVGSSSNFVLKDIVLPEWGNSSDEILPPWSSLFITKFFKKSYHNACSNFEIMYHRDAGPHWKTLRWRRYPG